MGEKGIQVNSMMKRKRPDARTFHWHIAMGKKHKTPETTPNRREKNLHDLRDNVEHSSLTLRKSTSKAHDSDSKHLRIHSELKSQPLNGDATNERHGSNALEACEQASSSNDVKLPEITPIEAIAAYSCAAERFHSVKSLEVASGSDGMPKDIVEGEFNCRVRGSEESSDSKPSCPSFSEYWVPVSFSHLQLEKYCEILIKNSFLLCSLSKRAVLDGLHDILITIRRCCDHPYLVDQSLEKFVNDGCQTNDYLSTGLEASGKLLLLDKFLQEASAKELRVLIVFQSNRSSSQLIHLRHILDDLLRQRFGEESYVHIYQEFDQTKRRAALDLFNNENSGRFVILIEKSSCQPSIKLSSVDYVILFNSDLNPINDLKSLQKMSIQSKCKHLKVFRLYASHSIEEKILVWAKEGTVLDNSIDNFSFNTCHKLLLWGASYLFKSLDDFHSFCSSIADLQSLSEHDVIHDVFHELSALLSSQESNEDCCSLISEAPRTMEGYVANISLYGEKDESSVDDDLPHHAIWISLLEGKNPLWKLLPESTNRMRRKVGLFEGSTHTSESEIRSNVTKRKRSEATKRKSRLGKSLPPVSRDINGKVAGFSLSGGIGAHFTPRKTRFSIKDVEEICHRRMYKLLFKQKQELREFYKTKRETRAEWEKEHQFEKDLLCQRYQESAVKHEELKKLDYIFREKVREHDLLMDIQEKELHNLQQASRLKEKQLKNDSINLLMMKPPEEQISSLVHALSLDAELGLEIIGLLKHSVHHSPSMSNSAMSENQHLRGNEKGIIDRSAQNVKSALPPDNLTDTEILSLESDGEDDAASMPEVALSNTVNCYKSILVPENGASCTVFPCKEQFGNPVSNRDNEGDGFTNMELSVEAALQRLNGANLSGSLNKSLESDGENDLTVMASGENDTITEPLNDVSDLGTSKGNHPLPGQKNLEPLENLPMAEVHIEDCNREASVGASSKEINRRNRELDNTSTVAVHQNADNMSHMPSPSLARNNCFMEKPQTCTTSGIPLPLEQGVKMTAQCHCDLGDSSNILLKEKDLQGDLTPSSNLPNREVANVDHKKEPSTKARNGESEGRKATNLNTSTMNHQQNVENAIELPSSLPSASCGVMAPQTGLTSENSSPLELPTPSVNHPCNQVRQTTGDLTVPNSQSPIITPSCQPIQSPNNLRNSTSYDLPMVQTLAIMSSSLQSVSGHGQPHVFSVGGTTTTRPVNNNVQPIAGYDPLQNELVRIQKEKEEAIINHEEGIKNIKSDCEKEIEEIRRKYDLKLGEAENAFLVKKQDYESRYGKVLASKLLADTLKYHFLKQAPSQEALLNAILQLSIPQNFVSEQRILPNVDSTMPAVQVVSQLSELLPIKQTQHENHSASYGTVNPFVGNQAQAQAQAPNICFGPISSLLMPSISTSFQGLQNQQILVHPMESFSGLHPQDCAPASRFRVHLDGSPDNPVLL